MQTVSKIRIKTIHKNTVVFSTDYIYKHKIQTQECHSKRALKSQTMQKLNGSHQNEAKSTKIR